MVYYSFVLICHNRWELTEQAINTLNDSLSPSHKKKGIELIIINNASEDNTKEGIEIAKERLKHDIEIVPVHLTENMGWVIATNIGYSKARGKIITILNNDLIFPKNWFDSIARTLEDNPSVGAASPTLSYGIGGNGVRLNSCQEIESYAKKFMEENKNKITFTHRMGGGCLSVKRELFSLIGGNDYWFGFGWHEDGDWALRARISGYKLALVGDSFVYHIGYSTAGEAIKYKRAAIAVNGAKLARKWNISGGPRTRIHLIETTTYSKEDHCFPCRIEDFNPPSPLTKKAQTPNNKTLLLVADWTNKWSQWRSKLLEVNKTLNKNQSLTIWIPKKYYPTDEIKAEVDTVLGETQSNDSIQFYFEEVPPMELLNFFSQHDVFLTVKEDFVNLHFKYLLEKSGLEIKVND